MAATPERLSETELAERAGTSVERIRRLNELGLLEVDADATYARRDVMRARVIGELERLGIEDEALATALRSGHLQLGYLESAGRRHPRSDRTYEQIASDIGVPFATLERVYIAFGLLRPAPDERVREEDAEILGILPVLFGAGVEEEQVLRLARVWGDSVRRVAQYLPHYFHTAVEAQFRERGLGDNDAYMAALREVGLRIGRSGEDLLGWLFRRHAETFMTEHQFEHVETALELAGARTRATPEAEAIAFVDLSGYTQLTEERGDEAAAQMSLTLASLVADVAARHRGSVVKLLGDGALLHFRDAGAAVRAALDVVASTDAHGLPPAHIGINAGPILYDEGDYFGRTVNMASRLASSAQPHEILVGETVVELASGDGARFDDAGALELKGIGAPVRVYRVSGDAAR